MRTTVAEIAARLGGDVTGDATRIIDRIAPIDTAGPTHITFVSHPRYKARLPGIGAGCVIVSPALSDAVPAGTAAIVTADPYLYYARLSQWWAQADAAASGVPRIHPTAVIEAGASIAEDAVIGPLTFVGRGAVVGAGTRIADRVTLGAGCSVGARCIVHSGVVIGADGFGFAPHDGQWVKIAQLGAVRIGDDVEIGANTCIDRGALEDTVIEDGVKLDNLIQIGHNVHVGAHSAMAGCVGVAGSARIGRHCTIGGGAIVLGHLELADHVHITAASVVSRSILKPGQYSGMFPIDDNASWEKNAATLRQLHALRERLRALEKRLA